MRRKFKRWAFVAGVALLAFAGGAAELYREIRPSTQMTHLNDIRDASTTMPEFIRGIPFEGRVHFAKFHGFSVRPPSYLIASHIDLASLQKFCAEQALEMAPASYPIPETPPPSWRVVSEFSLDPEIFSFKTNEKVIVVVAGHSRGMPSWLVQADYSPTSGLIVIRLDQLSDK